MEFKKFKKVARLGTKETEGILKGAISRAIKEVGKEFF